MFLGCGLAGTSIDQGIVYIPMLVTLVLTYLIYPLDTIVTVTGYAFRVLVGQGAAEGFDYCEGCEVFRGVKGGLSGGAFQPVLTNTSIAISLLHAIQSRAQQDESQLFRMGFLDISLGSVNIGEFTISSTVIRRRHRYPSPFVVLPSPFISCP
ncbi:hypothetical protein NE237_028767 [Protea cynaroides]|uniref:Uncharacterized protein n=1 Tax=Protea cynaroides TaxID=273540 RepID=A0A9Q0JVG4_9MAGN|nr:hypothetical protein NE237_028767 [Protea cynaroides]